jgi:TRAP-type C4-dicarboxylate transport system substrate-binding protein
MKKNLILAAALATVLASVTGAAQAADAPVTMRMSTWVPAQHPLNPALQAWADDIKKASGGSISMTLFPSEQLGKAFDHYDMTRDGITDFAYISPGYQPGRFPVIGGAALPFLFSNAEGGTAALDSWYRQYAPGEMKDIKVCMAFVHDPGTLHSVRKVTLPTDIKGMKVRPATSTVGQVVTVLGGTNVQASASESRDMLERGVADAITFPWASISLFGIDKVTKYHLDAPLYTTPYVWGMNKAKYAALSAGQKKVIDDHCTTAWASKIAAPWTAFEFGGRAKLAALPGHQVLKLTPAQLQQWRAATAPAEKQWAESVKKAGQDPAAVMASLKQALVKNKAGL